MRSFIGFGQIAYIGAPYTRPIKLGGIQGQTIPLLFNWISYGASTAKPNINILIDIDTAVCRALDQIRSVYIDNTGSPNPVYVYFPDTSYTIVAKPNSEGWYPAYTNSRKLWVIGEGFLTGNIPSTLIHLSNLPQQAAVNTEIDQGLQLNLASPVITRGNSIYNTQYGIPALGDQFFSSNPLDLNSGFVTGLWGTPYSSGFLYVNSLVVNTFGQAPGIGNNIGNLVIESTGIAGQLILLAFNTAISYGTYGNNYFSIPGVYNILNISNAQIKLDATQTWRMRLTQNIPSGFAQAISTYTQQ